MIGYNYQGQQNGFQSGGAKEHWKVLSATMVGRQEKFLNSKHSRMAKTVTLGGGGGGGGVAGPVCMYTCMYTYIYIYIYMCIYICIYVYIYI